MRWVVVPWLAIGAGCGRVGFDTEDAGPPGGDANIGCVSTHDEDGDGIADCADNCPHVAGPQADSDGDGVGDQCDPGTTQDRLALFSPLTGTSPFVLAEGTVEQLPDAIRHHGGGRLSLSLPVRDCEVWIGATLEAITGTERHLAIALKTGDNPHYYGEVYHGTSAGPYVALAEFDGSTYAAVSTSGLPGFPTGDVVFRVGARAGAPPNMRVWLVPQQATPLIVDAPEYGGASEIQLWIGTNRVVLHYIAVIETP